MGYRSFGNKDCGINVGTYYTISDFEIEKLARTGQSYWEKVRDFWWDIKDSPVKNLTEGQVRWLANIEASLIDVWRPLWNQTEGPGDEWQQ